MQPISLWDFERLAQEKLPPATWGYYASGAWDQITLHENQAAWRRLQLRPRVLVDVRHRDTALRLLGERLTMPVFVAPTAFHKLACPDGELASVRAAGAAGVVFVLSSLSNTPIEEVTAAATGPVWFQLYINKDREFTRDLIQRAKQAGCQALVITVDTPEWGRREGDVRNGFHLPDGLSAVNLTPSRSDGAVLGQQGAGMGDAFSWMLDSGLTWRDVDWVRSVSGLPIMVKGICRAEDARLAVAHHVSGIIVSNHGGRQLDGVVPTVEALRDIRPVVPQRIPVLVDGGLRRGVDVLKALALGATAVLLGRPILWGMAVNGQQGVQDVLEIIRRELDLAMALCGCPNLPSITPDLVVAGANTAGSSSSTPMGPGSRPML